MYLSMLNFVCKLIRKICETLNPLERRNRLFIRKKELQYNATPEKSDPLMARRLQEVIGGQWGETTGMMSYMFQGWNTAGNEKYKDLLLDTATEEIGHIEMLVSMVNQLLNDAPLNIQENIYDTSDPVTAAVLGGMDPQHAIVNGLGANLNNSNGVPWNAGYMSSSGNLLADMRYNVVRESNARLQVTRNYQTTKDKGVRDMLAYLMARETQHQLQFLKAADELEEKYGPVVPHGTQDLQHDKYAHTLYNFSEGEASSELEGQKARDGERFKYEDKPLADGGVPNLKPAAEELRNTPPEDSDATVKEGHSLLNNNTEEQSDSKNK